MKLYLAHPTTSRRGVRAWELQFEKQTGVELMNPFYDTARKDIDNLDNGTSTRWDVSSDVVNADLDMIKEADGIVALVDGSISYGTTMEMVYAFQWNKPVYVICTNGHADHPWIRYHASKIFLCTGEFTSFIEGYIKEGAQNAP
jgi:nucleoside 2-deoxyribosyltransferase